MVSINGYTFALENYAEEIKKIISKKIGKLGPKYNVVFQEQNNTGNEYRINVNLNRKGVNDTNLLSFKFQMFPSLCGGLIYYFANINENPRIYFTNDRTKYLQFTDKQKDKMYSILHRMMKSTSESMGRNGLYYTLTDHQETLKSQLEKNGWQIMDKTFENTNSGNEIYTLLYSWESNYGYDDDDDYDDEA